MKAFLSKYLYIVIWIVAILAVGGLFAYVVQANLRLVGNGPTTATSTPTVTVPAPPPPPPAPSVTLTLEKSKNGNSLLVQWANLPAGTTALHIFRGRTNSTSTWSLWETLSISSDELQGGSANLDLGNANGYSFYVEAVGSNGDDTGNSTSTILWESNPGAPETPSSTPPQASSTDNGGGSGQNNSSTPTSTPTSTDQNPTPPPENPTSSASSTSNNSSTPTGTPYYNPEVQLETYGSAQTGTFWVQHGNGNQSIDIGWQNLPSSTDSIIVFRSADQNGPWNQLLQENNPGTNGSYSLGLVDGTLNDPYYYELTAYQGTSTLATYGPDYLAPSE